MSLLGKAFLCALNDVLPEGRENLYAWHNQEHMPERIGVPGFRRARRFRSLQDSPEYLILYELDDIEVGRSEPYLARLNDPTPWSKKSQQNFRNSFRSLCRVPLSLGSGTGGNILSLRFEAAKPEELEQELVTSILPPIEDVAGISGVHLGITDLDVSGIDTVEKQGRAVKFGMFGWIVLVEGVSVGGLEKIRKQHLSVARLQEAGAADSVQVGIYTLEFCLTEQDISAGQK